MEEASDSKQIYEEKLNKKIMIMRNINLIILILIIIICILLFLNFKVDNKNNIECDYYYASYSFSNNDRGFLDYEYFSYRNGSGINYKLINDYEEYLETINMIDSWTGNSITIESNRNVDEQFKNYETIYRQRKYSKRSI